MRRGSTWTVILDVGPDSATGRRRQQWKGGYKTRKAAEAGLRELMAAVDSGQHVTRSATTVGEYLDEWIVGQEARLRPTTWNSYRVAIKRIKAGVSSLSLQALTPVASSSSTPACYGTVPAAPER